MIQNRIKAYCNQCEKITYWQKRLVFVQFGTTEQIYQCLGEKGTKMQTHSAKLSNLEVIE